MGNKASLQRIEKKNQRKISEIPKVVIKEKTVKQEIKISFETCKECKHRKKDGFCPTTKEFVPKKRIICVEFDKRK
jgi:hypothetical protein